MPNAENCSLEELEKSAVAAPSRRTYDRMMAIKALLLGISHDKVTKLYHVTRRSLSGWVANFNERGLDGLIEGHRPGRPCKMPQEQTAELVDVVRNPAKIGQIHWTGKKFHGYLRRELGIEICYTSVMRWIKRHSLRFKIPRRWPSRQDPDKRQIFVEKVRILDQDPDVDFWFLDETGVEGDPRPRRRLALRGEKIRIPYQGAHIRRSVSGLVCPRTGEFYSLIFNHTDRQVFQAFLDHANQDLQFERRRNILILDNASWHKDATEEIEWGRFEPLYLPPYSPDLNPIEELWLVMKGEWFADFYAKTTADLVERLCQALNWLIDRRELNKKTCWIPTKL
jgi:putative transposase